MGEGNYDCYFVLKLSTDLELALKQDQSVFKSFKTFIWRTSRVPRKLVVPPELDLPASGPCPGPGQQPGDEELHQISPAAKVRDHSKTPDDLNSLLIDDRQTTNKLFKLKPSVLFTLYHGKMKMRIIYCSCLIFF
jgi:hypothetical protein